MYVSHTNEVESAIYSFIKYLLRLLERDVEMKGIASSEELTVQGEDKYINSYKIMGNCCDWMHEPEDRGARMGELLLGLVQLE